MKKLKKYHYFKNFNLLLRFLNNLKEFKKEEFQILENI